MSKFDEMYVDLCKHILANGKVHDNRTGKPTRRVFGYQMVFDLREEFPALTLKPCGLRGPLTELFWIYKVHSNDVRWLRERKITIWDEWEIDEDGVYRKDGSNRVFGKEFAHTIGKGYGYVTGDCGYPEKNIDEIINHPESRRNIISLWQERYLGEAVLPPCVYGCQFLVDGDFLHLRVTQRSCDVGLGLPYNITQYAAFLALIAHVTGKIPAIMLYQITDCHIYEDHIPAIKEQIDRLKDAKPAPTLWINPEIKNFFDFDDSVECKDVKFIGYEHLGKTKNKMEVAI